MAEHGVPQLALFQQLVGDPVSGAYEEFEWLTGMTTRDAQSLRLYTFGGVPRDVVVTDVANETVPV